MRRIGNLSPLGRTSEVYREVELWGMRGKNDFERFDAQRKKIVRYCSTHKNKLAEFVYRQNEDTSQNSQLYYCSACATRLISKGFQLQPISGVLTPQAYRNQNIHSNHIRSKSSGYSKQTINILAQSFQQLSFQLTDLLNKYKNLMDFGDTKYCERVAEKFRVEVEIVEKYYEKLADIVEQYKAKHLNKLANLTRQNEELNFVQKVSNYQQSLDNVLIQIEEALKNIDISNFDQWKQNTNFQELTDFYKKYQRKAVVLTQNLNLFELEGKEIERELKQLKKPKQDYIRITGQQVQECLDIVEKQIEKLFNPQNQQSKKKSTSLHKFITNYEKQNKRPHPGISKSRKGNGSLLQKFRQEDGLKNSPSVFKIV